MTETLWDTGQESVLVCAPHDGFESNTAQAAGIVRKRIGDERASAWFVHAFGPDAFDRFHITSANISPASYPGLATVADRGFDYCISFHVFRGDDVLVGGLADKTLRDELGERISEAINGKRHVETERSEMRYAGKTQENIVNRLTTDSESGIQIEMPALIAHRYRKRVARTVADFFDERLSSSGEGKHD
ncbi:poly-gamma-glutamate hydrolase family protein [Halosimplex sp. J119]